MRDRALGDIDDIVRGLADLQDLPSLLSALQTLELNTLPGAKRGKLVDAIVAAAARSGGPLLVLSLPSTMQAELALFSQRRLPGLDRTAYLKASPGQIIRRLSGGYEDKTIDDLLIERYNFSLFVKDDWAEYFARCTSPIDAARTFLSKGAEAGGFSDQEITNIVLRNPRLVECIPPDRFAPNTAVALLISGQATSLWQTYDFSRLGKNHWRELFMHTNPDTLPEASRRFVENKDGDGFSDEELLEMAQKCHALINFLDPDKVPFHIAYELYLTGRADLLWKNYPFAQLDKSEWRKILSNPGIRIPDMFVEVARSNRFKIEELCDFAVKNERLLPILVEVGAPPEKIVDLLLRTEGDYLWAHYRFSRFRPEDWERLILGLDAGKILKPNAMSALSSCSGITEMQATRILNKDTVYCPHLPMAAVSPDMVVEILMRGKGYFLWEKYDFTRLDDGQWVKLLGGISGSVHDVEKKFLRDRAQFVENTQLNIALARREELIEFVDQKFIAPDLAVDVLGRFSADELWARFDFRRLDGRQMCRLLRKTSRSSDWPEALKESFKQQGKPLNQGDLLEIASANPSAVISLVSFDWVASMDDDQFGKLISVCARKDAGSQAIHLRLCDKTASWKNLGVEKLKRLLIADPSARVNVEWQEWPFAAIAELVDAHSVFAEQNPHPNLFFIWKHAKSLVGMVALSVAAVCAVIYQNGCLEEKDCERQHWNRIVERIHELDSCRSFEELSTVLSGLPEKDRSVVAKDVFVKIAKDHLEHWKDGNASVAQWMERLRQVRDLGWVKADSEEVARLIASVETSEYTSRMVKEECEGIKLTWRNYVKEVQERKRCEQLRQDLVDFKSKIQAENEISELEVMRKKVEEAKNFKDLEETASEVGASVEKRIEVLRRDAISRSVNAVSNGVEAIFTLMKSSGGFKVAETLPNKRRSLVEEIGHGEYCKINGGRFEEMTAAIEQYTVMKSDTEEKLREARLLDERFKNEFMTIDAGVTCSNLIVACESGIEKAKRLGEWQDPIGAYAEAKRIVDLVQSRDLRCWNLVDTMNAATTYSQYLEARNALVREYGHLPQLSHLKNVGTVPPAVAGSSFRLQGGYRCKFSFVGVICLAPDNTESVCVNVNNKSLVKSDADLYTLSQGERAPVSSQLLIKQRNGNKYFRVDNVNYAGKQGAPLFVKSEPFRGGY